MPTDATCPTPPRQPILDWVEASGLHPAERLVALLLHLGATEPELAKLSGLSTAAVEAASAKVRGAGTPLPLPPLLSPPHTPPLITPPNPSPRTGTPKGAVAAIAATGLLEAFGVSKPTPRQRAAARALLDLEVDPPEGPALGVWRWLQATRPQRHLWVLNASSPFGAFCSVYEQLRADRRAGGRDANPPGRAGTGPINAPDPSGVYRGPPGTPDASGGPFRPETIERRWRVYTAGRSEDERTYIRHLCERGALGPLQALVSEAAGLHTFDSEAGPAVAAFTRQLVEEAQAGTGNDGTVYVFPW